jgi:MinD superfamily P-loop ATPase
MLHFLGLIPVSLQKLLKIKIEMNRTIVKIDESRCTGCGACVKGCHGGALQIIDGKAHVINEDFCDGLGACIVLIEKCMCWCFIDY